ncbi:MAG: 4-alpha-glucanotransferase, partial [Candidatus Dormibacteraeota bacterium]|nr:4-alpha-glucanotransferase [Candidatus Dormibacteraeota bacterium]
GYFDMAGQWVRPSEESVAAVLEAMGAGAEGPAPAPVLCVHPGEEIRLEGEHELLTEDGRALRLSGGLPPDLPSGYHRLHDLAAGATTLLIVGPGACRLPATLMGWGWAVQLYALRSAQSWGHGDLADLRELGTWARSLGASSLLVNPLHAPLPTLPQESSPYSPSSRCFLNPLYIRVEEAPGAERLGARLAPLAAAGTGLDARREIDRDTVFKLKRRALEELWLAFPGDPEFDRHREREGDLLRDYATFCALAERTDRPWPKWDEGLRHPATATVAEFRAAHRGRIRFHEWLQWLLDRQLAAAAAGIGLINDLAIGVRADGADAWLWPGALAGGMTVGAPPDPFNAAGQDWSLPPFDPWRLRAMGYEPFIQTVRAALRHASGLRLDHVMGLFRLYWIPAGARPPAGVYVRYPHRELLDILALESQRAGALVVGEDLGTVEASVREELARRQVLSYRVFWFEDRPPEQYPRDSLAALTTHDLPTLAGIWGGSDTDQLVRERLRHNAHLVGDEPVAVAAEAAHRALAASPSFVLSATLEDALGVAERPNRPGTVGANWRLALPLPLEQIVRAEGPRRVAAALHRRDAPEN